MKKTLYIMLITAFLLTICGCKDNDSTSSSQQPASAGQSSGSSEIPDAASLPGTMSIDNLFGIVNTFFTSDYGFEFTRDEAYIHEAIFDGVDEGTLYFIDIPGCEIVITADTETDCFLRCYFRLTIHGEEAFEQMVLVASAFLSVLEPIEFQNMLEEAILELEQSDDSVIEAYGYGSVWTVLVQEEEYIHVFPT